MSLADPKRLLPYFVLLWMTTSSQPSLACPDDQYEQCTLGVCVCLPEIGGDVGRGAEHLKNEIRGQTGAPALEAWLRGSRNTAVGTSQPIPSNIRQELSGYIEDDIMNRARFKVGDNGVLNLAGLTLDYGDKFTGQEPQAVTLIDVIVFRNADDAYNDAALWAHELTHVKQFRDWGTRDFSIRYARDSNSVEDPAYVVQRNYPNWVRSQQLAGGPSGAGWSQSPTGGFPSGYGMQVCGCWGFNPVQFAPEPRCQSQSVRPNPCPGFCPGGGMPYAYVCQ
jgi:hypothetical protein